MISGVGSQLRLVTYPTPDGVATRPVGLDFGAIMQMAVALDLDTAFVADILPEVEAAIINPPEGVEEEPD